MTFDPFHIPPDPTAEPKTGASDAARPPAPSEPPAQAARLGIAQTLAPHRARIVAAWRRAEDAVDDWIERRFENPPFAGTVGRIEPLVERLAEAIARVPWRRPSPLLIGAAVGVAALAVLVVATGVGRRGDPVARPATTEAPVATRPAAPSASVETQIAAQRLARFGDLVEPAGDHVTTSFEEPIRLSPPFDAIDSVVFDAEMRRFRLWGVWPVGRNEICRGDDGSRFACGLMARATLQNHIARKKLVCNRMFGPDRPGDFVEVVCIAEGVDLALHMIRTGFAFPTRLSGTAHWEALGEAVSEKRGYWNGPQAAPTADRAAEDARSIPVGGVRLLSPAADTVVPFTAPTQDETPRVRIR
jgi:endonuclease YncB( thermonuclease family)